MSAQGEMAAPDTPGETEPKEATEQIDATAYGEELLKLASEEGHAIGLEQPEAEPEEEETPPEEGTEEEKTDEEQQVAAAKEKLVPLREVMEERAKKKRAQERAEKAEALATQLQERLVASIAPPTQEDPLRDINDMAAMERLSRSY